MLAMRWLLLYGLFQLPLLARTAARLQPCPVHGPIIVVGLPKTGTTSAAAALELLGFHTHHNTGSAAIFQWPDCSALANAMEHRYADLHASYRHCNITWIVTERKNVTSWVMSTRTHLQWLAAHGSSCVGHRTIFGNQAIVDAITNDPLHNMSRPTDRCEWEPTYLHAFYVLYYEKVHAYFKENGITNYSVLAVDAQATRGNGWQQLGPIRGRCPTPGLEFPHTNAAAAKINFKGSCDKDGPVTRSYIPNASWIRCGDWFEEADYTVAVRPDPNVEKKLMELQHRKENKQAGKKGL